MSPMRHGVVAVVVSCLIGCSPPEPTPPMDAGTMQPDPMSKAPVAVLTAPTVVGVGDSFELDGSASTADTGRTLKSFFWTNVDAPNVTTLPIGSTVVTTASKLAATIVAANPLPPGTYRFKLLVEDDSGKKSPEVTHTLVVLSANARPTAAITSEPQIGLGIDIVLDGSASTTTEGSITSYEWTNVDFPDGDLTVGMTRQTTTDTFTVKPTAGARTTGRFLFRLTVVNSLGLRSEPAEVAVTLNDDDVKPTAVLDISPVVIEAPGRVTLSGARSSDPAPGRIARYRFVNENCAGLADWPPGMARESASNMVEVTTTLASVGQCRFSLVVIDTGSNESASASAVLIVEAPELPTADLRAPNTHVRTTPITFDASRSYAPAPRRLQTYEYKNLSLGNAQGFAIGATLSRTDSSLTVQPGAGGFSAGLIQVQLIVVDSDGNRSMPTTTVVRMD